MHIFVVIIVVNVYTCGKKGTYGYDTFHTITKTCPCNIQKKKLAEKMKFFTRKILIFFLFLLKT